MKIAIYTAVVLDRVAPVHMPVQDMTWTGEDVGFYCFTNGSGRRDHWRYQPLQWHQNSSRRTARWYKLNPFALFSDRDFFIWHDGNMCLKTDPRQLVATFMPEGKHVAFFAHPDRHCLYREHDACVQLKKDDPWVMGRQISRYKAAGMPANFGLFETGSFIVRNSPEARKLFHAWWAEIERDSVRDQLSLTYVLWHEKLMPIVSVLPGRGNLNPYFGFKC